MNPFKHAIRTSTHATYDSSVVWERLEVVRNGATGSKSESAARDGVLQLRGDVERTLENDRRLLVTA